MRRFLGNLTRVSFGLAAVLPLCAAGPLAQAQQPPLVYNVENTGAGLPAPILPDFAHSPIIRQLPDPFVFFDGTRDTSWASFEQHRNEWKNALEQNEIGVKPDCHDCTITSSYAPSSTTKGTLTINVARTGNPYTLTFTAAITLPAATGGPFPYIIGMGSATGSMPATMFTGAATVVYSLNSVTKYTGGGDAGQPAGDHTKDPFYLLYPEYCAGTCSASNGYPNGSNHGQYAAWTWGVSRLIDAIQQASQSATNPLPLDTGHSAVTGCSYAGKMAMWSGALDERIALTIAQENGGGGAPSWRVSHEIETQGSVEDIDDTSYEWFGSQMKQYAGANVYKMPTDHHELMAMIAPRGFVQTGDGLYYWLGDRSATFDSLATEKIYANYGIGDRFGYYIDSNHFHCVVPAYQQAAIQPFINRFMFGQNVSTANLGVSWQLADAVQPGSQPTIDPNMFTSWWGSNKPTFPANDVWNNGGDVALPITQNVTLNSGDTVTTSYAVSMPGNHGAATVKYPYGYSETDVSCPDGTSYTLTIPAIAQSFTIPVNDNTIHASAAGSVTNPGCSAGSGQTTGGYFYALGIQSPGAGNPGLSGFTTTDGTPATGQTDPLNVTFNIADNNSGQGGGWAPTSTLNWQNPYSCTPPGCPLTPTLSWPTPTAGIISGTPLTSAQLNAAASSTLISGLQGAGATGLLTTAPIPGTFTYSPAAGTILPAGQQTLSVTFTPANIGTTYTNYTIATASVPIMVGTAPLTTTGVLSRIANGYQMVVTVKNTGTVTAPSVELTQATLGAASGSTIPASLGDIAPGASASVTLTFPSSAGQDGAGVVQKLTGTYTGGTFGGSFRAVLP